MREKAGQPHVDAPPHLVVADCVRIMGGGERFVLDLARHLPARGWRVTVLAYPDRPLHRQCLRENLTVHTARTRANGAPWTVLPLIGWMRHQGVDLLLTEFDKDLRTAGLAARLANRNIRILHSRECDGPIKDRPWIRAFHNRVADRILVASEATRRSTVESSPWLDASRLEVIGKGIPLDDLLQVAPVRPGPLRLGFLGQLVDRKRVDILLHAMRDSGIDATLRIAGRGEAEAQLRQIAEGPELAGRVHFDGFVEDIPAWFERIDTLVLPSLAEGWGYVLAEAAAAGRMILAFDSSSVAEVTPTSAGALLVDPARPDSLVRGLQSLAALGPVERANRANRLRGHAIRALGLDRMLDELDNLFRRMLEHPRR